MTSRQRQAKRGRNGMTSEIRQDGHKTVSIPFALLNLLFFCSGAAALIYEVSWNRQLGLLFGHTTHASATVLASYFTGMAIGYGVGGRWTDRISPLRGYAYCEWIVAVWACVIPSLLALVESSFLGTLLQHPHPQIQIAARVLFCVLLLLPATAALGATLPMMAAALVQTAEETHTKLTVAYACNTMGALTGALLASSMMLVSVGVSRSAYLAAMLSALCGIIAWWLASRAGQGVALKLERTSLVRSADHELDQQPVGVACTQPSALNVWTLVAALSGFTTLALEVLYARLFSLVFHNSTYTFGFVLFVFLLGLTLGSLMIRWIGKRFEPKRLLSWVCGLSAISVVLSVMAFVWMTQLRYFDWGRTFTAYYWGSFGLVLMICLVPAMLLGMLLPLVWIESTHSANNRSKRVGDLTLINTLAAALGAICASFVLIPILGLWIAFAVLAGLLLLPVLFQQKPNLSRAIECLIAVGFMLPLLTSDPETWAVATSRDVLLKRWNSSYGWIDVVEDPRSNSKKVRQNLHYRFGATGSNSQREFRQAHLPLLIHQAPKNALFLGLGTGMTSAGAVPHQELEQIVIVELIPEVVDAVRWLKAENRNVVDHPKVTMVTDDARHHLQTSPTTFDVIVSDLFVPWESETGYLYTVEHYQACRTRLNANGIFCQWLPMYQLGPQDFEMIADSLRSVFPHVTLWWGNLSASRPMVALIASEEPIQFDANSIQRRISQMSAQNLYEDSLVGNPIQLFELYAGDWPKRSGALLNSDEHPWVEFHAPISHQSGRLLRRSLLRTYYDQKLNKLNMEDVKLSGIHDSPNGRSWHRTVLFPE